MADYKILLGNCKETLKTLEDESVDSIVTDPPYELGFMNKKWDSQGIAYDVEMWQECLRVLKPGGYLLAFGGTRTYHRMTCAIEDAGFEIRDSIDWLFLTGFPKSINISKEINKRSGVETTDEAKRWEGWGTALKPAREPIVVARKPFKGPLYKNVLEHGTGGMNIDACRVDPKGAALHSEAYPSGRWPANIVITHSVNCINIGEGQTKARVINRWTDGAKPFGGGAGYEFTTHQTSEDGNERYDIYECVEGCPAKLLDEQSGIAKPKAARRGRRGRRGFFGRFDHASLEGVWPSDPGGGASRFFNQLNWSEEDFLPFFYVAKASNKERNAGLDHLETRSAGEVTGGRKEGSAGLNNPRAGAGRTSGNKNFHPTVKPVKLMEWLVRLVTPPGGTVLDPFMGSGTTGVAAINQGFNFIGCELMEEYIPIAEGRIEHALNARK